MKAETLDALLIDRELGELPPDVNELLDSYLELAPSERRHAEIMTRTVATAREAVRSFPELAHVSKAQSCAMVTAITQYLAPWLARAAIIAAVAMIGALVGYRTRMNTSAQSPRLAEPGAVQAVAPKPVSDGTDLWARYNVAFDAQSGTFMIAVQP